MRVNAHHTSHANRSAQKYHKSLHALNPEAWDCPYPPWLSANPRSAQYGLWTDIILKQASSLPHARSTSDGTSHATFSQREGLDCLPQLYHE